MRQIEDGSEQSVRRKFILSIVFLLAGIIYAIWPFDLIPDVPFVGWIDDIIVLIITFLLSWREYRKMQKEKRELEQNRA